MSIRETRGLAAASVVERFADLPAGQSRIVGGDELGVIEIAGRRVSVGDLVSGVVGMIEMIVREADPELRLEWRGSGFLIWREERLRMTNRDREGAPNPVQRIVARTDSEDMVLDLKVARNEILDLLESFEAIALLSRRCPILAEVKEWRAEAREKLERLGNRLSRLGQLYGEKNNEEAPE